MKLIVNTIIRFPKRLKLRVISGKESSEVKLIMGTIEKFSKRSKLRVKYWNRVHWSETNSGQNNKVFSSSSTSPKFLPWQCFSRRVLEGKQMYFLAKIPPNCHTFIDPYNWVFYGCDENICAKISHNCHSYDDPDNWAFYGSWKEMFVGILGGFSLPKYVLIVIVLWIQGRQFLCCWDYVEIFSCIR